METRESCRSCIHRRPISVSRLGEMVCHYLLDTGTPRGCPADHCTRRQEAPKSSEPGMKEEEQYVLHRC